MGSRKPEHVRIAPEIVIFHFAVKPHRMLIDRQQTEFMRRDTHSRHRMGVQGRVQIGPGFQQPGMDYQRAAARASLQVSRSTVAR